MAEDINVVASIKALETKIDYTETAVEDIKTDLKKVPEALENLRREIKADSQVTKTEMVAELKKYVTEERFKPVQLIVYGMVSAMLLTVLGAVLALVVVSKK